MSLPWKGYSSLRSPTHSLNHQIVGFITQCRLDPREFDAYSRLIGMVHSAIRDQCPHSTLIPFGSWETGLANSNSDINIQIVRPGKRSLPIPRLIDGLKHSFAVKKYPMLVDPSYLSLVHKQTGLEVEMYIFDDNRCEECLSRNSAAMCSFFAENPALAALYMVLKHLLTRESLYCPGRIAAGTPAVFLDEDQMEGQTKQQIKPVPGLTGYILCWLIIFFARFGLEELGGEPILGCKDSQYTIAELFVLFLYYYSEVYDFNTQYMLIETEKRTDIRQMRRYVGPRPIIRDKRAQARSGMTVGPNGIRVSRLQSGISLYEMIYRHYPLEDRLLVILNQELGTFVTEAIVGFSTVRQLFADTLVQLKGYIEGTIRTLDIQAVLGFSDYWPHRAKTIAFMGKNWDKGRN